ncbi:MAG: hypothetical protein ACRDVZ_00680 [Jiangellaceae bacterium]
MPPEQVHAVLREQPAGLVPASQAADEALATLGVDLSVDAAALAAAGARERLARCWGQRTPRALRGLRPTSRATAIPTWKRGLAHLMS